MHHVLSIIYCSDPLASTVIQNYSLVGAKQTMELEVIHMDQGATMLCGLMKEYFPELKEAFKNFYLKPMQNSRFCEFSRLWGWKAAKFPCDQILRCHKSFWFLYSQLKSYKDLQILENNILPIVWRFLSRNSSIRPHKKSSFFWSSASFAMVFCTKLTSRFQMSSLSLIFIKIILFKLIF